MDVVVGFVVGVMLRLMWVLSMTLMAFRGWLGVGRTSMAMSFRNEHRRRVVQLWTTIVNLFISVLLQMSSCLQLLRSMRMAQVPGIMA